MSKRKTASRLWYKSIFLAAVFSVLLQQLGLGQISLGTITSVSTQSPSRRINFISGVSAGGITISQTVRRYSFASRVGGVAFGGVAVTQSNELVTISYNRDNRDGQRLVVTLSKEESSQNLIANIPDWQLVPIARFADTNQFACFTLFGELENEKETTDVLKQPGNRVLGYHDAFSDTLLGWRLMQADLLIIDDEACSLPSENGKYLIGKGEDRLLVGGVPDITANRLALMSLVKLQNDEPAKFRSYVICDDEQIVTIGKNAISGHLSLTGYPYWFCWRDKITDDQTRRELLRTIEIRANESVQNEMERDVRLLGIDTAKTRWTKTRQQERFDSIVDQALSANLMQPMPELSRKISNKIREVGGINPVVYDSLVVTMRFAALFRHVKKHSPENYKAFLATLSDAKVPHIPTPAAIRQRVK